MDVKEHGTKTEVMSIVGMVWRKMLFEGMDVCVDDVLSSRKKGISLLEKSVVSILNLSKESDHVDDQESKEESVDGVETFLKIKIKFKSVCEKIINAKIKDKKSALKFFRTEILPKMEKEFNVKNEESKEESETSANASAQIVCELTENDVKEQDNDHQMKTKVMSIVGVVWRKILFERMDLVVDDVLSSREGISLLEKSVVSILNLSKESDHVDDQESKEESVVRAETFRQFKSYCVEIEKTIKARIKHESAIKFFQTEILPKMEEEFNVKNEESEEELHLREQESIFKSDPKPESLVHNKSVSESDPEPRIDTDCVTWELGRIIEEWLLSHWKPKPPSLKPTPLKDIFSKFSLDSLYKNSKSYEHTEVQKKYEDLQSKSSLVVLMIMEKVVEEGEKGEVRAALVGGACLLGRNFGCMSIREVLEISSNNLQRMKMNQFDHLLETAQHPTSHEEWKKTFYVGITKKEKMSTESFKDLLKAFCTFESSESIKYNFLNLCSFMSKIKLVPLSFMDPDMMNDKTAGYSGWKKMMDKNDLIFFTLKEEIPEEHLDVVSVPEEFNLKKEVLEDCYFLTPGYQVSPEFRMKCFNKFLLAHPRVYPFHLPFCRIARKNSQRLQS